MSVPGQPTRDLIAYGSDETQAFGRVVRSLGNAPDKSVIAGVEVSLIQSFPNPTVVQVSGAISAV